MLIFWEPMSRAFPTVPWPTRVVALFMWILFAEGVVYSILGALSRGRSLVQRFMHVLYAAFFVSSGIMLTFGGQVRSIAGDVAFVTIVVIILSLFAFRKDLRKAR